MPCPACSVEVVNCSCHASQDQCKQLHAITIEVQNFISSGQALSDVRVRLNVIHYGAVFHSLEIQGCIYKPISYDGCSKQAQMV